MAHSQSSTDLYLGFLIYKLRIRTALVTLGLSEAGERILMAV